MGVKELYYFCNFSINKIISKIKKKNKVNIEFRKFVEIEQLSTLKGKRRKEIKRSENEAKVKS